MMDLGLWISWYDLPESGREDYLSWLHGTFIPLQLIRPRVLWAAHYASEEHIVYSGKQGRLKFADDGSVPGGTRFILLFGAESAHVFTHPTPGQLHGQLEDGDRRMLSMRVGERFNIMAEQARVSGPGLAQNEPEIAPSPCIQLGSFNPDTCDTEEKLMAWFAQWWLPSMSRLPGCVRTRKLISVCRWAKHAILYEFSSIQARTEHFLEYEEKHFPEMAAWTDKVVRTVVHAPGSPSVARRLWPPVDQSAGTGNSPGHSSSSVSR